MTYLLTGKLETDLTAQFLFLWKNFWVDAVNVHSYYLNYIVINVYLDCDFFFFSLSFMESMKLSKRKYTNSGSFESLKHSYLTHVFSALLALIQVGLNVPHILVQKKAKSRPDYTMALQIQAWRRHNSICSSAVWYLMYMEFFWKRMGRNCVRKFLAKYQTDI